jgi:SAM-dependent methyltransferase
MTAVCSHPIDDKPAYNVWNAEPRTRLYKNEMLRYARLLTLLPPRPGTIADVGCGTGWMSVLLARRGWSVTAVDANPASLAAFETAAKEWNIRVHHGDLFRFRMEPADAVLCQEVLEHIPDYSAALRKMHDFLKPGGTGLFCVPYRENLGAKTVRCPKCGESVHRTGHLHAFDEKGFAESLERAGYRVLRLRRIVNKRAVKWLASGRIPVGAAAAGLDRVLNRFFPGRAAYLAAVVEKPRTLDRAPSGGPDRPGGN